AFENPSAAQERYGNANGSIAGYGTRPSGIERWRTFETIPSKPESFRPGSNIPGPSRAWSPTRLPVCTTAVPPRTFQLSNQGGSETSPYPHPHCPTTEPAAPTAPFF